MIKNIILSLVLLCLFIAIPLSMAGVTHVELGAPVMAFLKNTSNELNNYKIAIPDIPSIPRLEDVSGFLVVIDLLIAFINGIIKILNFFVSILNVIIAVLEYIFLVIKNLITLKDSLIASNSP